MKNRATVYNRSGDRVSRKYPIVAKSTETNALQHKRVIQPPYPKAFTRDRVAAKGKIILKPINDASSRIKLNALNKDENGKIPPRKNTPAAPYHNKIALSPISNGKPKVHVPHENGTRKCCCCVHKPEENQRKTVHPFLKKKQHVKDHSFCCLVEQDLGIEKIVPPISVEGMMTVAIPSLEPISVPPEPVLPPPVEAKKGLSLCQRLELWGRLAEKICSKMMSEKWNKEQKFHRAVWKLYKKTWKRKIRELERMRLSKLKTRAGSKIWQAWKRYTYVKQYKNIKRRIVLIQSCWRGYRKFRWYRNCRRMVIKIQVHVRRYIGRKKFLKTKFFIARLQAIVRLFLHKLHKIRNAAAKRIQRFLGTIKDRKELKRLKIEKKEQDEHEKLKRETIQRAALIKAKKAAIEVIERYWGKYLWKKELRKAREFLKKLPHDCRILWVKLNCAKVQAFDLKQEIEDLVNKRSTDNS